MSQLSPADFEFSEKEYLETVAAIGKAEELLAESGNLKHPLSTLKNEVFLEKTAEKGLDYSRQWLGLMLDKARDLHHRFLVKSNEYAEALTEHYENHFLELAALSGKIRDGVEDGVNRFGSDFEYAGLDIIFILFMNQWCYFLRGHNLVSYTALSLPIMSANSCNSN